MQPSLFDALVEDPRPADQAARDFAVDPANHVVLEASAGTGKTRVLVDRYVRLIDAGVDPRNILAVTFTRKAAAEMRDRVLATLRRRASEDARMGERWRVLRERIGDIQISTIDAFCFGLLREFPLEAGVNPAFEIADETEMARFAREAMDLTLRAARGLLITDENVRLLFARVKLPSLRDAVQSVLDRRHVVLAAVQRYVARRVRFETSAQAGGAFIERLRAVMDRSPHRAALLEDGPLDSAEFRWLHTDLAGLDTFPGLDTGRVQQLQRRLQRYFLTDAGKPRAQAARRFDRPQFASADAKRRHEAAIKTIAPEISEALETLAADVNGLLARGLARVVAIAADKYERLLDEHAVLDFAGMLDKAVALLAQQEEFARSRLKLQSRYHHVLVDEFQDTNRLQWQLVEHLIDAWREGEGPEDTPTSIFVVGDRKQSIYRFRHAEVTLLDEVARKVAALRPGRRVREAITHSFRAVPELLAFVNALSAELQSGELLDERFSYGESDRFPIPEVAPGARRDQEPVLGIIAEPSIEACARAAGAEIARLLDTAVVRDREGVRPARADDIAILFRARTGHQYFEQALEARGIPTYVYKGLGFFDAPEVQDLQALLRYLAEPENNLRAAEFLRSRLVRLSDIALARLAPGFAEALRSPSFDPADRQLAEIDRLLLERARASVDQWLSVADRVPPGELVDAVLRDSAYAFELRGRRLGQARENLKKMRALIRRVENRGYATLGRLAEYFETLKAGDESNAILEAAGCVNLMTIHAAKGLEFPIVFVVNVHLQGRGRSAAFSIIERGPDGEPEVAFGPSDATRLEDRREAEELRRLLYVSATRARDRLYFAGEVDQKKKLRRGHRSLASLFPPALSELFATAAASGAGEVQWASLSGTFAARVCRPESAPPPAVAADESEIEIDIAPLRSAQPAVAFVSTETGAVGRFSDAAAESFPGVDVRLLGTLVHRLFQRHPSGDLETEAIARLVPRLIRPDELAEVDDPDDLFARGAALFLSLRSQSEVRALLSDGVCHYELPFSLQRVGEPAVVVRGRIDCVVRHADGRLTILEFKTGQRRPEHEAQAAIYVDALRAAMPDSNVSARIVYGVRS